MRKAVSTLIALGMVLRFAFAAQAPDEALAIIDKAIAAHGLKGKEGKTPAFRGKNKGMLHVAGMDLEFTQDVTVQTPNKFKEVMEIIAPGNKVLVTTVYNGKEGWIKAGDKHIKVEKELLNELKEAAYTMSLAQGLLLKDKSLKLAVLGEVPVKGKPAVGLRVSKEGQKELSFYFDKTSGLLTKIERRARDIASGQEVTEERLITAHQDVGGRKVARRVEILRDGKAVLEAEVVEAQFLEKIGDSEFAKPE
jgi:hypothetical protein